MRTVVIHSLLYFPTPKQKLRPAIVFFTSALLPHRVEALLLPLLLTVSCTAFVQFNTETSTPTAAAAFRAVYAVVMGVVSAPARSRRLAPKP